MMMSIPDYATYHGMLSDFQKGYDNLEQIISNTEKFFWFPKGDDKYLGPVQPAGIIFFYDVGTDRDTGGLLNHGKHSLVLAENVPPEFVDPDYRPEDPPNIVLAPLDDRFNFKEYDESTKSLRLLQTTHCRWSHEATIESLCDHPEDNFTRLVWNAKISMEEKWTWRDENP